MRPRLWQPPITLAPEEAAIVARIHRAKLFVFLRQQRHRLFSPAFQAELGTLLYADRAVGQPPRPPAQLALATILQAYTGASDDEVIEATTLDRRWQLVLDCRDATTPPFSKATLIAFRQRLIAAAGDRRLIERTVEVAQAAGGFSPRAVRAALDSSPLWGAGRVEDTDNLLGHALRKLVGVVARQQGRELAAVAQEAAGDHAALLCGSSLKAALDLDWDEPAARERALGTILATLAAVEEWVGTAPAAAADPAVGACLATAHQVRAQDVTTGETGRPVPRQGVARDRRISVEDPQMRHGRKSRRVRVDGYKRHVLRDLDLGLVRAVGLTPANAPEASVTPALVADLAAQGVPLDDLAELEIDRAYLTSALVRDRPAGLRITCKAWPVRAGPHFAKTAFTLDWTAGTLRCPAGVVRPFVPGGVVRFPAAVCAACPLQARCTTSRHGRTVSIHPEERLLVELRDRQHTPAGRAHLRERVAVEHDLAHLGHWQGRRARYRGLRKNLFDWRRCAVVNNLHVLARLPAFAAPNDWAA
jgi:transposase